MEQLKKPSYSQRSSTTLEIQPNKDSITQPPESIRSDTMHEENTDKPKKSPKGARFWLIM
jgi:hypothetical protein